MNNLTDALSTIKYYDENASKFINDTINVDFNEIHNMFLSYIPLNSEILDFGCGSGRDTKYFLGKGYKVTATDGSLKMCEYASLYTGVKVYNMLFNELNEISRYDGIWACSSILHVPMENLYDIFLKMVNALKNNGIIYTSFKYGEFQGMRNGRYFTNMTENTINKIIEKIPNLHIVKMIKSNDVRKNRSNEIWINLILKKM